MNKYDPLELHLRRIPSATDSLTITFEELKREVGVFLPQSAYKHREWWGNQNENSSRPQAKAWMNAGFKVDAVQQEKGRGWVRFKRS